MWKNNDNFERITQNVILFMEAILYIQNHKYSDNNFALIQVIPVDEEGNYYGFNGSYVSKVNRLQISILYFKNYDLLSSTLQMFALEGKEFSNMKVDEIFSIKRDEINIYLIANTHSRFNCSYKKIIKHVYKELKKYFPQLKFKFDGSSIKYG
jgi:hypothetical protein